MKLHVPWTLGLLLHNDKYFSSSTNANKSDPLFKDISSILMAIWYYFNLTISAFLRNYLWKVLSVQKNIIDAKI